MNVDFKVISWISWLNVEEMNLSVILKCLLVGKKFDKLTISDKLGLFSFPCVGSR